MVINNRGGYGGQRYNSNGVDNRPYSDGGHFDEAKECDPADWNKPLNRNEKLEQYVLVSLLTVYFMCCGSCLYPCCIRLYNIFVIFDLK